jgi:glutamate racemase
LNSNARPIGVFDSGVGGLTVLRALRKQLPGERFIYLGDTARLPYGTKSRESIERYALQAAALLLKQNIKCLVVACNTASAIALEVLCAQLAPLPVIGVVEPGAEAGCSASHSGRIVVIATESTVRGGAYEVAISKRRDAHVTARACPLFVALAEEGLTTGPIVEAIAQHYLADLFTAGAAASDATRPDTLVLGCTHFPVLVDALRTVVGKQVAIVDSAGTTAIALERELLRTGLMNAGVPQGASLRLLATDGRERFARVGGIFLGEPLNSHDVELVDLAL